MEAGPDWTPSGSGCGPVSALWEALVYMVLSKVLKWVRLTQATGMTTSLNTVKQSRFKHLGELHKEWTEAGVSESRVTTLRHLQENIWNRNIVRSILPGLRRKRSGLLLSGPRSSFQMKVNLEFNLEIKVPESGGRMERHRIHVASSPVWSFHSQWWFEVPCHLLVLVHCVFWSPQSTQPYTRKS